MLAVFQTLHHSYWKLEMKETNRFCAGQSYFVSPEQYLVPLSKKRYSHCSKENKLLSRSALCFVHMV